MMQMERITTWRDPYCEVMCVLRIILTGFIVLLLMQTMPIPGAQEWRDAPLRSHNASWIKWDPVREITWMGASKNAVIKENSGYYDIVWQDNRDGNWEIYYTKITPYGFKMVNDSRITNYPGEDVNPSMVVSGNDIFIVWQRKINAHWAIYFSMFTYSNENISITIPPKAIRSSNSNATNPRIAMDEQGFIHVVWQEYIGGNWDVMYDKIDENGVPVFSPIDISRDRTNSTSPVVVTTPENNVDVLWLDDNRTPGYSILYRGLDCCGYFRTPLRRISVVSPNTTISASYNHGINLAFSCSRENESYEIVFSLLNDTGITVIDDINLTALDGINSDSPMIHSIRNRNFLVWRDAPGRIKFSIYDSKGRDTAEYTVSSNGSFDPQIAMNNHEVVVIWEKREKNETHVFMRHGVFPNMWVKSMKITQEDNRGKTRINATISSDREGFNFSYSLLVDNLTVYNGNIFALKFQSISFELTLSGGVHRISIILDPEDRIFESNESDNTISSLIYVKTYSFQILVGKEYYISPGNRTNMSIRIINTGNWEDNYTIMFHNTSPAIRITPSERDVSLNASGEIQMNFTLSVEENAKIGNYTIYLIVNTSSNLSKEENLTVHLVPRIYFSLQYQSTYYVYPDTDLNIQLRIMNEGNCNDTYRLYLLHRGSWFVELGNESINVSAGEERNENIKVHVPSDAPAFSKEYIVIGVKSEKSFIAENATMMILVAPAHRADALVIRSNFTGTDYYFQIMVTNEGNLGDFYNFNISGELGEYSILNLYSSFVPRFENVTLNLSVYIPSYFPAGSYNINFNVLAGNETICTLPLSLTVPAMYSYSANATVKDGTILLTIKNEGNVADSIGIYPHMNRNITWILWYMGRNYTNSTYVVLQPNQTATVKILPAKKLSDGEYPVILHLKSASGMEKDVKVTLKLGSRGGLLGVIMDNLLYIVIAIVAVVAIILYLYFRE